MDDYESVLLVKPEVFVYKIPPRTTSRGYRAADWNLGSPDWTGRMRIVVKSKNCVLKLEDKITGELFAQSPIEKYPGVGIEAVTDSSRYFVVRIQDESGKAAFIGLGFGDRSDSFDLNVALQDHFKWIQKEEEAVKETEDKPNLDLGFKDGQTIKINMKITKKDGQEGTPTRSRPKTGASGIGLLPPPPGGVKILPPATGQQSSPSQSNIDLLNSQSDIPASSVIESWGDFTSAPKSAPDKTTSEASGSGNSGWVTF